MEAIRPYDANSGLAYRALVKGGGPGVAEGTKATLNYGKAADEPKGGHAQDDEPLALILGPSIGIRQIAGSGESKATSPSRKPARSPTPSITESIRMVSMR